MSLLHWFAQADALNQLVAVVLCAMSVLSWVLIIYKTWLLSVANRDLSLCQAAWFQAQDWQHLQATWGTLDSQKLFVGLLRSPLEATAHGLAAEASHEDRLSSGLRQVLQSIRRRLQFGQDILATMGATSPFIGLLGTVWGIFNALAGLTEGGAIRIEEIAGPVGEALVMTAAGLAVAIPAVLGYNLLGRRIGQVEAELEGFAHDVRALLAETSD